MWGHITSRANAHSTFLKGPAPFQTQKALPLAAIRKPLSVQARKSAPDDSFVKSGLKALSHSKKSRSEAAADKEPFSVYHGPTDRALVALKSTPDLDVDINGIRIAFLPKHQPKKQGLIIYPGAFVHHKAYAAVALKLAEKGYPVVIANTPFNVIGGNFDRPSRIIEEFPQVKQWAVGGHSFGGRMVDYYGAKHGKKEKLKGLVYWGTFPILDFSKSDRFRMLTLLGTKEDMLKKYAFLNYEKNMPSKSQFIRIPGGNHSFFADYGWSFGDGTPEITRPDQQAQVAELTARFLDSLTEQK